MKNLNLSSRNPDLRGGRWSGLLLLAKVKLYLSSCTCLIFIFVSIKISDVKAQAIISNLFASTTI